MNMPLSAGRNEARFKSVADCIRWLVKIKGLEVVLKLNGNYKWP